MKIDLDLEAIMLYKEGVNKSAGYVEFQGTKLITRVIQRNDTNFTVEFQSGNVTQQWLNTDKSYVGRYRQSTYAINTALFFLLNWMNEFFFDMLTYDLQNYTYGVFRFNHTNLDYNDGYLGFGFSADFRNTTILKNKPVLMQKISQFFEASTAWAEPEPLQLHEIIEIH